MSAQFVIRAQRQVYIAWLNAKNAGRAFSNYYPADVFGFAL